MNTIIKVDGDDYEFKSESIKSYTDDELCGLVDSVLDSLDSNKDGFITYAEYKSTKHYDAEEPDNDMHSHESL